MFGELKLSIELGNDAMQTHDQLADAVAKAATAIRLTTRIGVFEQGIRDANGNTVGRWELTLAPETCEGCGRPLDDLDAPGAACNVCGAAGDDNDNDEED